MMHLQPGIKERRLHDTTGRLGMTPGDRGTDDVDDVGCITLIIKPYDQSLSGKSGGP